MANPNYRPGGRSFGDLPKLGGNQNVRNTKTGEFADEQERFEAERSIETDKEEEVTKRSELEREVRAFEKAQTEAIAQIKQGAEKDFQLLHVMQWYHQVISKVTDSMHRFQTRLNDGQYDPPYPGGDDPLIEVKR